MVYHVLYIDMYIYNTKLYKLNYFIIYLLCVIESLYNCSLLYLVIYHLVKKCNNFINILY